MTPAQFLAQMKRREVAPAYLFLGAEPYQRDRCRAALLDAALTPEERADGVSRHDLTEVSLAEAIDDARSLSLFAAARVIWIVNAEAAMPKGRAAAGGDDEDEGGAASAGSAATLTEYMRNPTPGVVLVVEATRYGWEGDDKKRLERAQKFYSAIRDVVELAPLDARDAMAEAQRLAKASGLCIEPAAMELLLESLGYDIARIAAEIEKLALFARDRAVTEADIPQLVPDARATTIFSLVNALGRRDRVRALEELDTLVREGEYLPLALSFLSTQFRLALIAKEANLRGSNQVFGHFQKLGVPMFGRRAEQVADTATKFSKTQLERALKLIYDADVGLRSARPDDRTVMERFVTALTA